MNRNVLHRAVLAALLAAAGLSGCTTTSRREAAQEEDLEVEVVHFKAAVPASAPLAEGPEDEEPAVMARGGVEGGPVSSSAPEPKAAVVPAYKRTSAKRKDSGGGVGTVEGGVVGGVLGGVVGGALGGTGRAPAPPPPPVQDVVTDARPPEDAPAPNAFTLTAEDRLSTFAVDVDTASYTLSRRYVREGVVPPPHLVRVEEWVNAFRYRYPAPSSGAFAVHLEAAPSPFAPGRHFVRVGVQGKVVSRSERKPTHLVFLVDTSGSMSSADRLPLAQEAMRIAVRNLNENDTVALVTYAGGTRDVLPPTPASQRERIETAIASLSAGGGTAMGSGMELAYRHAVRKAAAGVVSRVVVMTDGDTNIGPNLGADAMLASVQKYLAEGVTLTTVGFGMGNYRDDLMERLANKGNGNCFYIDGPREARKVFEERLTGTLEVIAKDVKVQVEFDPRSVRRYRLVGYENRAVADRDFRNDKVDAGEIGAGHSVTAVYEVELTPERSAPVATVRVRAKKPSGTEAAEQRFELPRSAVLARVQDASADFRFALAAAGAADVLRGGPEARGWSLGAAQALAAGATDGLGDRKEFVDLLSQLMRLRGEVREVSKR